MQHRSWFATAILLSLVGSLVALADATATPLPQRLSDAGLFVSGSMTEVRPGLLPYTPLYPLWSDGAAKRRWIELPAGKSIDAALPQNWDFPAGTRLWKEFSLQRRIETRLIERLAGGAWRYASYVWQEDGANALLAPAEGMGIVLASDAAASYEIPAETDCHACHEGGSVPVLGFSALQLSPDRDALAPHAETPLPGSVDLPTLVARGLLHNLPAALLARPPRIAAGSPTERAALGYLHANCGHCHSTPNEEGASVPVELLLAQDVSAADSTARILRSLLDAPLASAPAHTATNTTAVVPGHAHDSTLLLRARSRDGRTQMPPLGTAIPDTAALALLTRWIDHSLLQTKEF